MGGFQDEQPELGEVGVRPAMMSALRPRRPLRLRKMLRRRHPVFPLGRVARVRQWAVKFVRANMLLG